MSSITIKVCGGVCLGESLSKENPDINGKEILVGSYVINKEISEKKQDDKLKDNVTNEEKTKIPGEDEPIEW